MERLESHDERRSSPRCSAKMFIKEQGGGDLERACTLSIGGCGFKAAQPICVGQEFKVVFWLSGCDARVDARIGIINTGAEFVGARFLDLPFESERLIARWLDERSTRVQAA